MAFSFGNSGNAMTSSAPGAGGLTEGPDLELIQTEGLGFLSLAGESKVQLTSTWSEAPAPTANLISIASRAGLVAAAGPDAVHIAKTETVRAAFQKPKDGDSEIREFQPEIKLPLPIRVSQLAFTPDEQYIVLSAETGGGLAVYDVQSLSQGSTQAAFELPTNGEALRAMVPNPVAERAELCAMVTTNGSLLMANLKDRVLVSGPSGQVLRSQVSCVAWSRLGKQVVAGAADGSLYQITPDGQEKAHIPKPPKLGDYHVASVVWLENDVFLVIHNPTNGQGQSLYHIITRQGKAPSQTFVFQKIGDPVEPFSDKTPHHSVLRLREFPPNLQDLLIVSSTAVENIGLLSRSKTALSTNTPADKITGVFTTTELADDSKRAQVPMGKDYSETFPIGSALDLSSKDKVYKPIPTDEMDESPGPLPGLWVLNNEGVLASWWIVYNESIREGKVYPGLAAIDSPPNPSAAAATTPKSSAFAAAATTPAFGSTTPAAGSLASPWSNTPTASGGAFGGAPAFGQTAFGGAQAATPSFGTPSFGAPSAIGSGSSAPAPAFGQSSSMGMGNRASPWASAGSATPAFGQPSAPGSGSAPANPFASKASAASPFATATSTTPASGGFAGFANKSGFASVGLGTNSSVFGSPKPLGSFGGGGEASVFGSASKPAGGSALGSTPFVLGTTFKADAATANDNEPPASKDKSMFGNGFLNLGDANKGRVSEAEEEDMPLATPTTLQPPQSSLGMQSTTPTTTPAPSKFFGTTLGPSNMQPSGSIFAGPKPTTGDSEKKDEAAKPASSIFSPGSDNKSSIFGPKPTPTSTEQKHNAPKPGLFGQSSTQSSSIFGAPKANPFASNREDAAPKVNPFAVKKEEPAEKMPEPPLPPDTISKAVYPFGDSSSSSGTSAASPEVMAKTLSNESADDVDDAPLPPMPSLQSRKKLADMPVPGSANKDPKPAVTAAAKPAAKAAEAFALPTETALPKSTKDAKPSQTPFNPFAQVKPLQPGSEPFAHLKESGSSAKPNPFARLASQPISSSSSEDEDDLSEGEEEDGKSEEGEAEEASADEDESEGQEIEEEEDGEGESEAASEGSGIDVAKDLSPSTTTGFTQTPGFTPQSSFAGVTGSMFSNTTRAEDARPANPFAGGFQLPRPIQMSPRSPSPQRRPLLKSEGSRSVSAPGMASRILSGRPSSALNASRGRPASPVPDVNVVEQRKALAKKEAEESRVLEDDEYEILERELEQPPEPTLQMPEFVYSVGSEVSGGSSIASQAEAVYHDVNRMIQSLAVNARNLKGYVAGQNGQSRGSESRKLVDDLEDADDWVLCDVKDLGDLIKNDMAKDLESGRVKDCPALKAACDDLKKEIARLRAKHEDMKKVIMAQTDPDQIAASRSLPLSAEQAAQQNDLRKAFTAFTKLLAHAEEALVTLKTKIVAAGGSAGKGAAAPPTVDAVLRTIVKMTAMVEKRSGDVDMLETQMRRLRLGSAGPGSREGSPFTTPQKALGHNYNGSMSMRASMLSPGPSGLRDSVARSLTSSVTSLGGSGRFGTPSHKKLTGYSDADKAQIRMARSKRESVKLKLKAELEKNGPFVVDMPDD